MVWITVICCLGLIQVILMSKLDTSALAVPPERIACGIGAMQVELAPHYSHDI